MRVLCDHTNCLTCGAPIDVVNQTVLNVGTERLVILRCTQVKAHQWEVRTFMRPYGHPPLVSS